MRDRTLVSVVKISPHPVDRQIWGAVREAVGLAGGIAELAGPGKVVLIKPNLVAMPRAPGSGALTNPQVCRAIADIVMEHGARPVIAESSAVGVDTEKVIQFGGYGSLREQGYEVVDLKKEPKIRVSLRQGRVLKEVTTYRLIQEVDSIISVPVMKTHDQTEVTLSLKNLKGLVADDTKRYMHRIGVVEGVCDFVSLLRPSFAVIDGIVGQEGMGPLFGAPVEMDLIIAGKDLVAVDAVASKIMGFHPSEINMITTAAARGLGIMDLSLVDVKGCAIENVVRRFKRASEDSIDVPGLKILFTEGTCTGCRNTVLSALSEVEANGMLDELDGKIIIAGVPDESGIPEEFDAKNLIVVGVCARKFKDRGVYVEGCPPSNIWVAEAAVGRNVKSRIFS